MKKNGESVQSPVYDTVIFAAGMRSNNQPAEALTTAGIEFKQIGDCNKPSQFHEALTAAVDVSFVQFPRYIGRPPKASITPAPSRRGII